MQSTKIHDKKNDLIIMKLKNTPDLYSFLSTYFPDSDPEADGDATKTFIAASSAEKQQQILSQIRLLLTESELPLDEFGSEANRWFGDTSEAQAWLLQIAQALEGSQSTSSLIVKDSNGTVLVEGVSVQVIKDLKVKGGSSDLKRGTLIKKIHLVADPEVIECRVNGSILVLKTCFLKKA